MSDDRPVNLKAFENLPPDEPVVMINLLKFNRPGGHERYLQYSRDVAPHLKRAGGTVRYAGASPVNIIGDGERPWWDAILIVEYPSSRAFTEMVSDPGYQKIHQHRAAALQQGDLIATSTWVMG